MFMPVIPEAAVLRTAACLRSGWIGEGKAVAAFEEEFASRFRLPRALSLNSGTAALHLALIGAGVEPGGEVITTAQTFVATAMAALYVGAQPVFADLQQGGPNLDPTDVERRITPRTKAIVVVHYGGYPCDMDEICAVADRHGLIVIEDAAHALGATYQERPVGSLGDFGAFSFQAIKQLTTGDGGMLVCASEERHREASRRRWFGIDREHRTTSELGESEWDIREVGYKYHMNDIAASLGLAQLESFGAAQARRRQLNKFYRERLAGVSGVTLLQERPDRESACWLFTMRVERRVDFVRTLRGRGVEAGVWHRRIDAHSLFGGQRADLPNLASFDDSQVAIPLRESLTDEEASQVIESVRAGW
jgi:perosamine synthetase